MNNMLQSRFLWGGLLIVGGILFLLQNLLDFQFGSLFWALVFGLGALFFLSVFISNRMNWWGLIPGITLLGIALVIALDAFAPELGSLLSGTIILGGIGLSFLVVYLLNREFWWAIIPAGVLLSLAVALAVDDFLPDTGFVALFFIGMALTFAVVARVPTPEGKMQWAWIPAGVLGIIGVAFGAFSGSLMAYAVPIILIGVGGILDHPHDAGSRNGCLTWSTWTQTILNRNEKRSVFSSHYY